MLVIKYNEWMCLLMAMDIVDLTNKNTIRKPLEGKVAVVTGGSRGIGATIAKVLAKNGAFVAINYQTRTDSADAVVKEIEEMGGTSCAIQSDVSKPDDVKSFIEEVKKRYGKIDILVNNAGITRDRTFRKLSDEQ